MTTQNKRIFITAQPDEIRIAITLNNKLLDLDIERPDIQLKKSNIYKGRISSIEPSLAAVFVDYGSERHGFLPFKEISNEYYLTQDPAAIKAGDMKKLLKLGQELVIQVEKEERGNKGAALTTFISLAGSYLVLMPNSPRAGGISRRVEATEREHLQALLKSLNVPETMGIIVRTAGVGCSKEELAWDLNTLLNYWEAIKKAAVEKPGPYLIHQESDVVIREIRDFLREDVIEVLIDNQAIYEKAREYVNLIKPDFLTRIKLYQDPQPLLHYYNIEKQIETAYQREVRLPAGGSIVIDQTEALVAVDINSARATKGGDIEETARSTNLEAAEEIARQLRLRDIGGLIVIDFIDMSSSKNQRDVEIKLRDALKQDRARIQTGKISRFGLLEMSRQRLAAALNKASMVNCPRCKGQGMIRSIESLAMSIIHKIEEQIAKTPGVQFELQLPVDLAAFMINDKKEALSQLEQENKSQITIVPNPYFTSPDYQMKYNKPERRYHKQQSSTQPLLKPGQHPEVANYKRTQKETRPQETPMVGSYLSGHMKPAPRRGNAIVQLLKWLKAMLANTTATEEKQKNTSATSQQGANQPRRRHNNYRQNQNRSNRNRRPRSQEQGQGQHGQSDDQSSRRR